MPCESGDMSLIYHVTTFLMCHMTCQWVSLILSHYPAKFGVHRPCESRNIMLLICHVINMSREFVGHQPAKFGVHRPCESGVNVFYLSRDHGNEMSRDFVGGILSS